MYKVILLSALCAASAIPIVQVEIESQPDGHFEYVRFKRSANTTAGIGSEGTFARHDQRFIDTKSSQLDASVFAARDPFGQISKGAQIDYSNLPTNTKFSFAKASDGLQGTATGTIFKNDNHMLEGSAFAQRLQPNNVLVTGGEAKYSHIPSSSDLSVYHKSAHGFGEKMGAAGNYNFFKTQDGRGTIGLSGTYERTRYPGGFSTNNWGGLLHGNYNF